MSLEPRFQLSSGTGMVVYPPGFVGPLPSGARIGSSLSGGIHFQPDDVVNGMALTPAAPVIGTAISATLTTVPSNTVCIGSTTWTYMVSCGGLSSPVAGVPGGTTSTSATIPDPGPGT